MEQKMFCYQCQETAGCKGCTVSGVCGKKPDVAAMQDLLVYVTKGLSAVIVLLALLYLGVKNIHLGPTLPAFLSPNIANVLVENFGIAGITTVEDDMKIFGI